MTAAPPKPGPAEHETFQRLLAMAREEDLGPGDITSTLLPESLSARARFVARQELSVCGVAFLQTVAAAYDAEIRTTIRVPEGGRATPGQALAEWAGPARGVMSAERVALNFLQRLCGVATTTWQCVQAVAGTGARIYDTRKTTPGWRDLEKYAVRCGGGQNHRHGLYDAVLIKDNHLAVLARNAGADPIEAVSQALESLRPKLQDAAFVMIEVDTLDQLDGALKLPIDIVLLDNMPPEQLRQAVAMRDRADLAGRVELEASGGITPEQLRAVAAAGVERISMGSLTHSAGSADIGLDIELG